MTVIGVPGHDVVGIRADNPGPFTLSGTNSWLLGRSPAWLIDPGPELPEHLDALDKEIASRGGLGGVALTHNHPDHSEALLALRTRHPRLRLAGASDLADFRLSDGSSFGPLRALATPGHAPDHLSYLLGRIAFTGDAVLGQGSVFVSPYPGALTQYLDGLRRLRRHPLELMCPGHGPIISDPAAKLDEYLAHRLDRERHLVSALDHGKRTVDELLDDVWSDVPLPLRPAAVWTLAAHLDRLAEQGRLPAGVERPALDGVRRP